MVTGGTDAQTLEGHRDGDQNRYRQAPHVSAAAWGTEGLKAAAAWAQPVGRRSLCADLSLMPGGDRSQVTKASIPSFLA